MDGKRLGEWLRSRRLAALLTQEELAARAGVSVRTVQSLESQTAGQPRPATLRQLCDVLGPMPEPVTPAQLPPAASAFTGRQVELAWLDALTAAAAHDGTAPLGLGVVSGGGGVGKTALVRHWAHRVRESFPDGQLYVNLRGYDGQVPVPPGEVLARFLRALGDGPELPLDVDERAARYRSAMAGRRMLVVLDNAHTEEQVRPLLPGTAASTVVITSRDQLPGLVAVDGARRLMLTRLPPADAVALLRRLLGDGFGDGEAGLLARLAEQCAFLPLALRIAAERVAGRGAADVADLVAELGDHRQRLDLLDTGTDSHAAIRAVFSWSYQHLPDAAARAFRLAGLHPGPDLTVHVLAALIDSDLPAARRALAALTRSHLLEPARPDHRYGIHDLLRAYAVELAASQDRDEDRRAALTRVFDHYLATAAAAMAIVVPEEASRRPQAPVPIPAPASPSPPLADRTAALRWLDQERSTLTAVCAYTATGGWPTHSTRLASLLGRYYLQGGHYTDLLTAQRHACEAARSTGDRVAEAHALIGVGSATARLHDYPQAVEHFRHALAIFQEVGHAVGQARARSNLGIVLQRLGDYRPAIDHHQRALALFEVAGDHIGAAYIHGYLGLAYTHLGQFDQAAEHHHTALALCRRTGYQLGEGYANTALGQLYTRQGRYRLARERHSYALDLFRRLDSRAGEAEALIGLGEAATGLGRWEEAAGHHRAAVATVTELGDRYAQARALNGLAEAGSAGGQVDDALAHHAAALEVAELTGDRHEQARAHTGLANARASRLDAAPRTGHRRAVPVPGRWGENRAPGRTAG